jgi:hypothetical protein
MNGTPLGLWHRRDPACKVMEPQSPCGFDLGRQDTVRRKKVKRAFQRVFFVRPYPKSDFTPIPAYRPFTKACKHMPGVSGDGQSHAERSEASIFMPFRRSRTKRQRREDEFFASLRMTEVRESLGVADGGRGRQMVFPARAGVIPVVVHAFYRRDGAPRTRGGDPIHRIFSLSSLSSFCTPKKQ